MGNSGGFEFYLQNRGEGGARKLAETSQQFIDKLRQDPSFAMVSSLWRADVPQLDVDVDRAKAKTLGVPIDSLFDTLAATLGTYYVNDFNKYGRTWQVLMSQPISAAYQEIGGIYARSENGEWCRSRRWRRSARTTGPETLERFNNLPSVKIIGSGAPGARVKLSPKWSGLPAKPCPAISSYDWGGASYQGRRKRAAHRATPSSSAPSWSS